MVVQQTHPKREDSNRVKVIVSPVGRQGRPGTPGVSIRFFDTLQEALDLQPRPENGVTFQVREETDPENFGFYVFDDREPEGYRYLGERWDDEYLTQIENRIDAFEQDVEGQVQGLETRVDDVESDMDGFKTEVEDRVEGVETDVSGFKAEVNQRVDEVEDIVTGIGSGEGGKAYDSLADALSAGIPDNVVFQTPEGYWRRDSSNPEGAEFLRPFPDELERFAGEFKLEQGGISSVTGELVNLSTRVRTTLFKGSGSFEVNEGYSIYQVFSFDENGNFIEVLTPTGLDRRRVSFKNNNWTRVVFTTQGGADGLDPSEEIIKKYNTGYDYIQSSAYVVNSRDLIVDTDSKIIEIPQTLYLLINGQYLAIQPTTIDYSTVSGATVFILYDRYEEKLTVESLNLTSTLGEDKSLVGYIRSGKVFFNGQISEGATPEPPPEIEIPRGQAYIVSGQNFKINTTNKTIEITIPLYVISNGVYEAIVEPKLIDYSTVSGSTVFILYDENDKTIEVTGMGLSEKIPEGKSLVGTLRIQQYYRNININGSYILDGEFISGGSYSQPDPDPTPIPVVQNNILVDTSYAYEGADIELPTSSAGIYDSYDSLMARYPQYIQKKMLGQSRDVVSMSFDSYDKLPVNMRVDYPTTLTEGELVTIENLDFYVEKVWEGSSSSIGSYILLNPVTTSSINPTGVILNSEGSEITSYSSRRYSRYTLYLNGNPDHAIYVSASDYGAFTLQGVFEAGTPSVPNSGNLTDSEGNVLATYTNLVVSDGSPVYCYYFDFSGNNRDESELKNRLFFIGGLHGNEKKSMAGQLTFFTELCDNWRGDKLLRELRNVRYSVIPAANPWGIDNNTTYNANGVDLNRNFEEGFTITDPLYFRWSGPSALSEPEAVAINEEIKNSLDTIFAFVDSHNDSSVLGGFMSTLPENFTLVNAVSRNINNNINLTHPYIPTYLFAWTNSGTTLWTTVGNPNQEDFALTNNRSLDNQQAIDSATDTTITVGGVTYSRDENSDEDLTNLYRAYPINITPPGASALQARKLGITNSYIMEVGGQHFMTTEQSLKLQVEITTNVIGSISKYLLY